MMVEKHQRWTMHVDGVVNISGSDISVGVLSPEEPRYQTASKVTFPCTNDITEYESCILGLLRAIDIGVQILDVYRDSALIITQTTGAWRTRDPKLVPCHEYLQELVKQFHDIDFNYVPCTNIRFANALDTLTSMIPLVRQMDIEPLRIDIADGPSCSCVDLYQVDGPKP